jgi:hypothetical protein
MTRDRVIGHATKCIIVAFTFAFWIWYFAMKWMALRLEGH